MSEDLKAESLAPCPFCGSTNIRTGHGIAYRCWNCDAMGPPMPDGDPLAAWNRRALQPPPHAGGVEAALRAYQAIHQGLTADVLTAHNNRVGASEWMRDDDRELRDELRKAGELAEAALSTPPAHPEPVAWRVAHPNRPDHWEFHRFGKTKVQLAPSETAWIVEPLYAHPAPADIAMQEALHPEGLSPAGRAITLDGEGFGGWDPSKLSPGMLKDLGPFTAQARARKLAALLAQLQAAQPDAPVYVGQG